MYFQGVNLYKLALSEMQSYEKYSKRAIAVNRYVGSQTTASSISDEHIFLGNFLVSSSKRFRNTSRFSTGSSNSVSSTTRQEQASLGL